jgi:ABC-2 type transport system ATP-binding protein
MTAATQPSAAAAAVELRDVVKDFAIGLRGVKLRAVDGLNLRVAPGEVYGLLGPNGSGKSTAIKLILGLLQPSAGHCTIFGLPSDAVAARRDVGYVPEAPNFPAFLTGRELVRYYGRLCGLRGARLETRIGDVIALVDLAAAADRRVGTYSKGMLQRIGLAQAMVHDPKLLILDEPTAGVDPVGAAAIAELILRLKREGRTVLITSHLLAQIEEICDRIAIIDHGRLVLERAVRELAGVAAPSAFLVQDLAPADVELLRAWLAARGKHLAPAMPARARLDRIFLEQVRRGEP